MESRKKFLCGLSNQHILKDARKLPCGFNACAKCLEEFSLKNKFMKCGNCNGYHLLQNKDTYKSNTEINNQIKAKSHEITKHLNEKLQLKLKNLNELNVNADSLVDNYYEYMKDELLIRVESLKIELDEIYNKLSCQIDEEKAKTQENIKQFTGKLNEDINAASELVKKAECKKCFKNDNCDENMYLCEKSLNGLEELESSLMKSVFNVKIELNNKKLDEHIVASLQNTSGCYSADPVNVWELYNFDEDLFRTATLSDNDDDEDDDDEDYRFYDCEDDDDDCPMFSGRQLRAFAKIFGQPDEEDFAQMLHWDKEDRDYSLFFNNDSDDENDMLEAFQAYAQINDTKTGNVKWFDMEKGYGFIVRDDTHKDLFFHHSDIKRLNRNRPLQPNDRVKFGIVQSVKGLKATDVEYIR